MSWNQALLEVADNQETIGLQRTGYEPYSLCGTPADSREFELCSLSVVKQMEQT